MNETKTNNSTISGAGPANKLQPSAKVMLPHGCMQEFQDEANSFFQKYDNPVVGYVITTPEKLRPIKAHCRAGAVACVVVRSEEDFDLYAATWHFPYVCNVESLDLTECMTVVALTGGETENDDENSIIHIPDNFIYKVIDDSMRTGQIAVILCSPTRALLFVFPFDDADTDGLQAAAMVSGHWRPYPVYDDGTLAEAAASYGHLNKRLSEGWGVEIPSFFSEEKAKALREDLRSEN
ncbi:hypothetical protein BJN34_22565 [Cupriavidus necator]|uniref:Uncharacterized protein n=1 Tax=Cupriavidus necator TaxID=106590 RepID=A0A1U9UVI2_CUPNE|nr:hypothetical protein [Cupriavidus necator]AQV96650.1 hypothetical protein BJN34_22565 [Cupriavidus necator]